MSLINVREKTIQAKVVYYGTALSGKTTSLKHVHRVIDPDGRVELVSLNTEGDRTFFFDFLPIPLGTVHGYQLRFQAFTVPGQVKYNLTRRYVLRGADAVIFVADSSPSAWADNIASLATLYENLLANGLDQKSMPILFEYNKRDVPGAVSVERLRAALNPDGRPDCEAIAVSGAGVFEAFSQLCAESVESLAREYRVGDPAAARQTVERRLFSMLLSWRDAADAAARQPAAQRASQPSRATFPHATPAGAALANAVDAGSVRGVIEVSSAKDPELPDAEHLLQHAVETNIAAARMVSELSETRRRLADHVGHLAALHQTGVALASELDPERLLEAVLAAGLRTVGARVGSILVLDEAQSALSPRLLHGLAADPIVATSAGDADLLAQIARREPFVIPLGLVGTNGPTATFLAPLVHQGEVLGVIAAYAGKAPADHDVTPLLRILGAVAAQAAVALVNARLHAAVEGFNRELERKVAERTRDLEKALTELRQLDRLKDDFLASMSHELLTPLQSIASSGEILAAVAAEDGPSAAAERREFSGVVTREAARLTSLLQNVLDMAQLESGAVEFERRVIAMGDIVAASYERLHGAFAAAGCKLDLHVAGAAPAVLGDARWLGRAVDVLLGNALKFAPRLSAVTVSIHSDERWVRLEVSDRGPGVPPALRATIFEKFKQLGEVLTDKPEGLGLGLPMARTIASQMGGDLEYETCAEGGSTFVLTLPTRPTLVRA